MRPKRRTRAAAAVAGVALFAGTFALGGTAGAEPSGDATGVAAILETVFTTTEVPPTPTIVSPPGGSDSIVSVNQPGLVTTGILNVSSIIDGDTVNSAASVIDADIFAGTVTAEAVSSECTAGPEGAEGTSSLVGAEALGTGLDANPPPNTTFEIPGLATIVLNEQTRESDGIIVDAIHATIQTPFGVFAEIIISESACFAGDEATAAVATSLSGDPNLTG
jgi:hypothetical protein